MSILIEKINEKNIIDYVVALNAGTESQVIRHGRNLSIDSGLLENFVANHVEIQNAIMAVKSSAEIDHTLYTGSANFLDNEYMEMLCALFNHIVYLKSDNFSARFIVGNCSESAKEIYNSLKKSKRINGYVSLFEEHKQHESKKTQYEMYKISASNNNGCRDNFIDECISQIKVNPYIVVNICGFTLKEIEEDPEIVNMLSHFPAGYLLFCGEYSVGCYIFRDKVF